MIGSRILMYLWGIDMARKIKRDKIRIGFYILIAILALTVVYGIYSFISSFYSQTQTNNNLPVGIVYEPSREFAYIATSPKEQELMNQINGNMLFLFNNDTSHCFENNNTGINSTLYWIDWYSQSNQTPFNKFGVIKLITTLQAYNTTQECATSEAVMETTIPQVLYKNNFISTVYN